MRNKLTSIVAGLALAVGGYFAGISGTASASGSSSSYVKGFNAGFDEGTCQVEANGKAEDGYGNACVTYGRKHVKPLSYTAQVLKGTATYAPCVKLNKSKAGRILFKDMVSDTWDEGRKRTVKAQISYVKQGCRNGL